MFGLSDGGNASASMDARSNSVRLFEDSAVAEAFSALIFFQYYRSMPFRLWVYFLEIADVFMSALGGLLP